MPDVLGEAGLLGGVRQGKASTKKEDHAPRETFLNWEILFRGREWSTIGHDVSVVAMVSQVKWTHPREDDSSL